MKNFRYKTTVDGIVRVKDGLLVCRYSDEKLATISGISYGGISFIEDGKTKVIRRSQIDESVRSLGPKPSGSAPAKSGRKKGTRTSVLAAPPARVGPSLNFEELLQLHTTTQAAANARLIAFPEKYQSVILETADMKAIHAALQSTADLTRRKLSLEA